MAIIVYVGTSRLEVERISATVDVVRSGIAVDAPAESHS
jgi:hypothetical protein